jgi:prophage regulatory protein
MNADNFQQDRFVREAEVHRLTGLSRTTRWRLEQRNKFPKRRQISDNAVAWLESEIVEWMAERTIVA